MENKQMITTRLTNDGDDTTSTEIIEVQNIEAETTEIPTEETQALQANEVQAETSHGGPHIMPIKADYVSGLPITTTGLTTTLFLFFVFIFCYCARKILKNGAGKFRTGVLSFVDFTYQFLIDSFDGDREYARAYYPLIIGVFVVIFFGNLFGLVIDWVGFIVPSIHYVARPIFSDLASTLPLALLTVGYSLYIASKLHGPGNVLKGYAFNWTGQSFAEKCVNVFVGWLHIIGIPSSVASLALRLFGNIFAGVVLIAVLAYLGDFATQGLGGVGVLMTLPFWFFELFVAFVQAAVFTMLMIATFKQAHEHH